MRGGEFPFGERVAETDGYASVSFGADTCAGFQILSGLDVTEEAAYAITVESTTCQAPAPGCPSPS
jgi:hypothetical protein